MQVDTCDSFSWGDFDTVLAVYTGDAVSALSAVASNDNAPDPRGPGARVSFTARAGSTYRIAVDGAAGPRLGIVELSLRETAAPSGPPPPPPPPPPPGLPAKAGATAGDDT